MLRVLSGAVAGNPGKPVSIGLYTSPGIFFCMYPGAPVSQAPLSVCSHVVIRRVVETGLLLELSTGQDPWRLHQAIKATRGRAAGGHAGHEKGWRSPGANLPKLIAFSC